MLIFSNITSEQFSVLHAGPKFTPCRLSSSTIAGYFSVCSGIPKVGNGWAQAQPILSGAQPTQPLIMQSKFKKIYQLTIFAAKYEIHNLPGVANYVEKFLEQEYQYHVPSHTPNK